MTEARSESSKRTDFDPRSERRPPVPRSYPPAGTSVLRSTGEVPTGEPDGARQDRSELEDPPGDSDPGLGPTSSSQAQVSFDEWSAREPDWRPEANPVPVPERRVPGTWWQPELGDEYPEADFTGYDPTAFRWALLPGTGDTGQHQVRVLDSADISTWDPASDRERVPPGT